MCPQRRFKSACASAQSDQKLHFPHEETTHHCITKTYLYNFDLLKPHFYIVKLGFTWVYIIFLISAQKHTLWYLLEPPWRGGSNEYPQSMFCAEMWKISEFLSENFPFLVVKFSIYLNRRVFVMTIQNLPSDDLDQTAANAQADHNLCWAHTSLGAFLDVVVKYFMVI